MKGKLAMHRSPRCTATSKRTRQPCQAPAIMGWTGCRFHGPRGGGPKGARNGASRRRKHDAVRRICTPRDRNWLTPASSPRVAPAAFPVPGAPSAFQYPAAFVGRSDVDGLQANRPPAHNRYRGISGGSGQVTSSIGALQIVSASRYSPRRRSSDHASETSHDT